MDTYFKGRVLTGGCDGQVILWKLSDETQLLFKSAGQTVDCVHTINDKSFVTSCDNSTIEVWSIAKKTPVFSLPQVHNSSWICSMVSIDITKLQ
jgi:ribosomal RNA-processing protein 9